MALLEFYGNGCVHCERMKPLVSRLSSEEKLTIESYEVWENSENEKKLSDVDKGLCGGVPFFYNTETGAYICGETDYEELREWAKAKTEMTADKADSK